MKIKNITVLISGLAANQKLNSEHGIDEISNLEYETSDNHLFNHCEKYFEHGKFPADDSKLILNSDDDDSRLRWPWLVSIGGYCSGTLIGPRWVVTAAHCCRDPVNQYVYAGSDSYMDENFAFQVEDYRSHDRFNIATAQNNICLLKLKKNVPFTERSYPICLVSRRTHLTEQGAVGAAAGWGEQSEFGIPSAKILDDNFIIENHSDCRRHYHYYDERKSFCAGSINLNYDKNNSCIADSGSPFVMLENENPVLVGIASLGYGCPKGRPKGIYTNVSNYISWLTNKAIEMKASMISARVKRLVQLKSTTPNAKDIPSIRREHRRRQKMLKKRKKTNQMLRQAKLTERFTLKMASKGIQVAERDLKKFLKTQIKKKKRTPDFLSPNEIQKLQTINIRKQVPKITKGPQKSLICSKSEAEEYYQEEYISISECDIVEDMFECNFQCTMNGMIPNSRIRCEMGSWSEIYFNQFHHLCMASEAKRPKIQPGRPLFTTAQPKAFNVKAKISTQKSSLVIPKPTKKSSTGVI